MFDIEEYLEDNDIEYWTEGKNVSPGWIGIQCPFCSDRSNHCGISPNRERFFCYICEASDSIEELIMELSECSYTKAKEVLSTYGQGESELDISSRQFKSPVLSRRGKMSSLPSQVALPSPATSDFPKIHTNYLLSRNFNPKYLIHKYKLQAVHTIGKYRFRIIAPYFLRGKIVSFSGRDITEKAKVKYLDCPVNKSIVPTKRTLYNIDTARDPVMIVEGITDVWRIGSGAVAASTSKLNNDQIELLLNRGVNKAFVCFDADASDKADRYANQLSAVINQVEILTLPRGDPADQSDNLIKALRRLLK